MAPSNDREIRLLLEMLDRAFEGRAWHGTSLAGAVRGLSHLEAQWRPGRGRHNIWELVLHTAYWKYAVRRRLEGGKRGAFPRPGSNWPRLPARADATAWAEDVRLLHDAHQALRDSVERFPARQLAVSPGRSKWIAREMIHGVAAHDLYHTGQIQLIKRLLGRRHRGSRPRP